MFFHEIVNWGGWLPLLLVVGSLATVIACLLFLIILRAHRLPDRAGKAALLGQVGTVTARLSPAGRVQVLGEDWTARTVWDWNATLDVGQSVRVVGMRGLTLFVEPVDNELATYAHPIWFGGLSV
jgi:membrane protein implicated in regulation of membrane protease activity